jgi:MORN repeat
MVLNELREGIGKLTDSCNGMRYTGEYLDDLKHGFGRLETKNFLYVGSWFKGQRNGIGYQKNYEWKNDKTVQTSSCYFGYWRNDCRHGIGYETTPSRELKGEF